jgi:hypothetical protein
MPSITIGAESFGIRAGAFFTTYPPLFEGGLSAPTVTSTGADDDGATFAASGLGVGAGRVPDVLTSGVCANELTARISAKRT